MSVPRGRPLAMLVKIWPKLSETFILEEVLAIERRRMPLRLYALEPPTDAIRHPAVAAVRAPVICVPARNRRNAGDLAWHHARLLAVAPVAYLRTLWAAARRGRRGLDDFVRAGWLAVRLRDDGVAHLHAHFISTPADVGELVARLTGVPFSISAHAKDIYLSDPADLRRKLAAARFTVTCTEDNRRTLAAIAPGARIRRMYHGIDLGAFHPRLRRATSGPPLVLAVGRLRPKKGLDTLIDACHRLRARGAQFRCEIVGYGEERERLLAQIERAGLADRIVLPGKLMREQVIERYAAAAVFVQPSRVAADGDRDGIPNVLLEAMAMALPVVASRVAGIPELVADAHNGLLVEPDQPRALADAIEWLLQDPVRAARLGHAARARVSDAFDNDRNLHVLTDLLEKHDDCGKHCVAA